MSFQAKLPSSKTEALARVLIEHEVTRDHYNGDAWPPPGDGWHLIRPLPGWRHEWRRISLVDTNTQQAGD
jgi:hypothetical protein